MIYFWCVQICKSLPVYLIITSCINRYVIINLREIFLAWFFNFWNLFTSYPAVGNQDVYIFSVVNWFFNPLNNLSTTKCNFPVWVLNSVEIICALKTNMFDPGWLIPGSNCHKWNDFSYWDMLIFKFNFSFAIIAFQDASRNWTKLFIRIIKMVFPTMMS